MEQDTNQDTLPEESQLNSAGVEGSVADVDKLSLEELQTALGKQFPTKEAALKSIKDTFSYVGKRKEDITKEVTKGSAEITEKVTKLERDLWFKDHPEHQEYRGFIEKLGDPAQVVETPEYKSIFEKASGYDKTMSRKTVMESNPRLGQVVDKMNVAQEAVKSGNYNVAADAAVEAVIGTYLKSK